MGLIVPPPGIRSHDLSGSFFKFGKSAHAEGMVREGKIRLGTLHGFRAEEQFAAAIGDVDEGTETLYDGVSEPTRLSDLSPFSRRFIDAQPEDAPYSVFQDCLFEERQQAPNCYIYCVSEVPTAEHPAEYDACVEIFDIQRFGRAVTEQIGRRLGRGRLVGHLMVYTDRWRYWQDAPLIHPAFLKSPRFAGQYEYRFVWESPQQPAEPHIDVTCPGIIPACRRINLP